MAMDLSFAEPFFTGNGECELYQVQPSEKPTFVYQAAISLPKEELIEIGEKVFSKSKKDAELWAESLKCPFDIVNKVRETDRCDDATIPVTVYLDHDGYYSLTIYSDED